MSYVTRSTRQLANTIGQCPRFFKDFDNNPRKKICPVIRGVRRLECPLIREFLAYIHFGFFIRESSLAIYTIQKFEHMRHMFPFC